MAKKGFEWAGEFHKDITHDEAVIKPLNINQPIITISRQYGSGSRDIARQIAENLNIPFYDSQLIDRVVESSGIGRQAFEKYETNKQHHPVVSDLSESVQTGQTLDDRVFAHNASVIQQIADEGSCIIVERCADYILRKRKNIISVFIYSDIDSRKQRVVDVYHEADGSNVMDTINKNDKRRSSYYEYYSNQVFGNAQNYDLCLNSSALGIDGCIQIIEEIYKQRLQENESK